MDSSVIARILSAFLDSASQILSKIMLNKLSPLFQSCLSVVQESKDKDFNCDGNDKLPSYETLQPSFLRDFAVESKDRVDPVVSQTLIPTLYK